MSILELHPSALRRSCDPTSLPFQTTAELPDLENFIGQPRAYRGLELGSEVTGLGYNIYVMGLPASGRTTLSREYLEQKAAALPAPNDLCYINNFADPHQPKALPLPTGRGTEFRKDMETLIMRVQQEIQQAFNSDEYSKLLTAMNTAKKPPALRMICKSTVRPPSPTCKPTPPNTTLPSLAPHLALSSSLP